MVRSLWINTSPYLLLEDCITVLLNVHGLRCIGFLGSGSGLWSLHVRHRSQHLYTLLPELIKRVESDDIPEGQRGDFDLNDAMLDWSEFRRTRTRWRRLRQEFRLAAFGISDRILGR
jgi:hypothetical protein